MGQKGGKREKLFLVIGLALFFLVNLTFLTKFPFLHSDESWLAGLSRTILNTGSFSSTETFFNLWTRYPHAIKLLFHILQIGAIKLFGYRLFSVRLLSLLAATATLGVFYAASKRFFGSVKKSLLATLLLACDVQFIYASHFARQEIFICLFLVLCFFILMKYETKMKNSGVILLGIVTGIAIGFHPNSFLIACMCFGILLLRYFRNKSVSLKQIGYYLGITAVFAALFIAWSYRLDSDFLTHYFAYGDSEFGVLDSIWDKLLYFPYYLSKLFRQVGGTYYLPDIRPQFIVFGVSVFLGILFVALMKKTEQKKAARVADLFMAIAGIFAGIIIIGRYNQTAIVFVFPFFWILTVFALSLFETGLRKALAVLLIALIFGFSVYNISPWLQYDYQTYLDEIAEYVPSDAVTLANLNAEFYFDEGCLIDYRNLEYLNENDLSFADYIRENEIEYIVISDEMEFIAEHAPSYDALYGPIYYLDEMQTFLNENCEYVGSFPNNTYGVRIVSEINGSDTFVIRVYKVSN
jgi:4-amino-4-deoxy-L-arabinose transferase-like glycosyltransferase